MNGDHQPGGGAGGLEQQTSRGSVEVELFVRAGKDGETLGGCPVCHRFFMILLTKAEYHPEMSLIVTTVNPARNLPDILREQVGACCPLRLLPSSLIVIVQWHTHDVTKRRIYSVG